MATKVEPKYCLRAERRGCKQERHGTETSLVPIPGRAEKLDPIADSMIGKSYGEIAKVASQKNEAQLKSNYLDYLFSPQPTY